MLYSLQRFRFQKPAPPFELGGEYLHREGQSYLQDALGLIALNGPTALLKDLEHGAFVVVRVDQATSQSVRIAGLRVESRRGGGARPPARPHAPRFANFLERVRRFFIDEGLLEVLTPTLVTCPGLEPSLEPFAVPVREAGLARTLYLPTSPEIHLKKAMALGLLDIFEIKSCFRRGEFPPNHAAEFAMLEWYRGFAGLELIEADLRRLLGVLDREGWIANGLPAVVTTDFAELFRQHLDYELRPMTSAHELGSLCDRLGVNRAAGDSFGDLFHRLLMDRLEQPMAASGPLIVKRFPPSQAALAKLDRDGWADRFEFYWNGLEIANAFNEVTDPHEQEKRWTGEQAERARLGTSLVPQDPELLEALRRGLPPSGGIALGLERLYMACTGVTDIRELRFF